MRTPWFSRPLPFLLLMTGHGLIAGKPVDPSLAVDSAWHHLRSRGSREWSTENEKAEGPLLEKRFDAPNPGSWNSLSLRQAGIKLKWVLKINGTRVAELDRDHNDQQCLLPLPPGTLKEKDNLLQISTEGTEPDDIHVGEIILHTQQARKNGGKAEAPSTLFTASLSLSVVDAESKTALPARLTITDAASGSLVMQQAVEDDSHAARSGVIYTLDGRAKTALRPGKYRVFAGRGFEYSLASAEITLKEGEELALPSLEIRREVPTPGLAACDTHLHTFEHAKHGDATVVERLVTLAGEGIELAVSTEHDKIVDYTGEARRTGANRWFTPVTGCEVTSHRGHFNIFPVVEGARPPVYELRDWGQIFDNIQAVPGVRICILNHGRDLHKGYVPLAKENFDVETGRFKNGLALRANAMEVINSGAQQNAPLRLAQDWFALLRGGHRLAAIGSSDSHTVNFAIVGQARTYIECADADASNISIPEAMDAIVAGKTHVSFGLLTRLGNDPAKAGEITATVLGPSWTRATKLVLWRNGEVCREVEIPMEQQEKAGIKATHAWNLREIGAREGDFFCAVATGPGITAAWWPIMPPYQSTGPDFIPYVMGISSVHWVK